MQTYYDLHARRYAAATFSTDMRAQYARFLPYLPPQARILDVGSGSGRDACYFQKLGHHVTALEPSRPLCQEICRVFSGEIVCTDIQSYQPAKPFDAIWACASLHHLTQEELLHFFAELFRYLRPGGVLYLSGKNGIPTGQAPDGRYFLNVTDHLVAAILSVNSRLRLKRQWYTQDAAGRNDFRWMNLIFGIEA